MAQDGNEFRRQNASGGRRQTLMHVMRKISSRTAASYYVVTASPMREKTPITHSPKGIVEWFRVRGHHRDSTAERDTVIAMDRFPKQSPDFADANDAAISRVAWSSSATPGTRYGPNRGYGAIRPATLSYHCKAPLMSWNVVESERLSRRGDDASNG